MCEKLKTAGDGLGRNGRFGATAETLAVQLGRGNWTTVPNKQGRADARAWKRYSRGGPTTLS